jgi:hypothetical protein
LYFFEHSKNFLMKKFYVSPICLIIATILTVFSYSRVNAQTTCTATDPLLCGSLTPLVNPFAGVQGSSTQQIILSNPILVTGSDGCLLVSFTQGGTATVSNTSVTIITATGEVTCTNVTVTNGKVCIKICDPRITQGTQVSVRLDFIFALNSTPLGTVIVDLFAVISASAIPQTTCAPTDPLLCGSLTPIPNPFAGVQGNSTQQSILSNPILVTGTDGCLLVSFTQGGTATVSSTTLRILTAMGEVTCTGVPVTNGKVCMKICDPRITQGSQVSVRLDFIFSPNTAPLSTVAVDLFAVASAAIALPLNLLEFKAAQLGTAVKLSWTTSQEENVSHFEIIRSDDGHNFSEINKVHAKAGSGNNYYEFLDAVNINGEVFYRLNMVDLDGRAKLSPIVMVRVNGEHKPVIVIAPNPVQSSMKLKVSDFTAGSYNFELRNSSGQLILNKILQLNGNEHTEIVERTNAMSKGLYVVSIYNIADGTRSTSRVILE